MTDINGYWLEKELSPDNSGFAKWGFAQKDGLTFFIKEFLSPVYPIDETILSPSQLETRRNICIQFEMKKRRFYNALNECSTGNIVNVIDFFRYGNRYYTITDKVDSDPITPEHIANFSFEQKILITKVILHSFDIIHRHGIVHSDVKHDNVLFKRTKAGMYTAKIIDFDSSFLESEPPETDEDLQGDMVYFAPEAFLFIAEEDVKLTTKIDVFALGILIHQYFSGELPGIDHSKYDYVFESVLDGAGVIIDEKIPEGIAYIIRKMLDVNPDNRPSVGEVFAMMSGDSEKKEEKPVIEKKTDGWFHAAGDEDW